MTAHSDIHERVAKYYAGRLHAFGPTPQGVDWNSEQSQILRFEQLIKLVDQTKPIVLSELGCGYGALVDFLASRRLAFRYCGVDVSPEMVAAARPRYSHIEGVEFVVGSRPPSISQYCVASGIFNVKLQSAEIDWHDYMLETLDILDAASAVGFAFNALTRYSDADRMRDDLYYADPLSLFDHCKRRYSRNVALLHDYGLYEFTILVRKNRA